MDPIQEIPIDQIQDQELKRDVDERGIDQLSSSLRGVGLLQPLIVALEGETYVLIAGQRRLLAAKRLHWTTVPCVVVHVDHERALQQSIHENLHREELDPVTEAQMFAYLSKNLGKSNKAIAQTVSMSEGYVSQRLSLLTWLPDIIAAVKHKQIHFSVARELARVTDKEQALYLLSLAIREGVNYRTMRMWVLDWEKSKIPPVEAPDKEDKDTQQEFEKKLKTNCYWCDTEHPMSIMATVVLCPVCMNQLKHARDSQDKT